MGAVLAAVSVLGLAGCANREGTSYQPNEHELAPDVAVGSSTPAPSTPPASAAKPKQPKPAVDPRVLEEEQAALDAYTKEITPIVRAGGAEARFHADEKKAAQDIPTQGLAALVPPYQKYEEAVSGALAKLKKVKAPEPAAGLQNAYVDYYTALAGNLGQTVEAMKANDGDKAAQLNKEYKPLVKDHVEAVLKAVQKGGFDMRAFAKGGRLVPKIK